MNKNFEMNNVDLTELAKKALLERNFLTDFSSEDLKEVDNASDKPPVGKQIRDAKELLWCSIDNDDSKDLDQLTYAEELSTGRYKIYIAVAEVDHLVPKNSIIDLHARQNTVSIYTPTKVFPMLPEGFSTDLTSLNENADRLANVVEVEINQDGSLSEYTIYPANVFNYAKLAYKSVSAWLDGNGVMPERIARVPGLEEQMRLQDKIAHLLKKYRHENGALTLETVEIETILNNQQIVDMRPALKNRGRDLIEDFMIAANTSTARFLKSRGLPSFRRIVRTPKRWDRIVEIAREKGESLPEEPDSKALDQFLTRQRIKDPEHFPDLSLTVIKLLGNGEYVVESPNDASVGHFGLALKDYTHSTAPNRRYPDLITQRIVNSAINETASPYVLNELERLAQHCTRREDEAEKVERKMKKSAAIVVLSTKFDETFDAIVTGSSKKGTWVRIFHPPVEGKLVQGYQNKDVGDHLQVKLVNLDIENGFIDFVKVG
jgi:exoribonuclease-2